MSTYVSFFEVQRIPSPDTFLHLGCLGSLGHCSWCILEGHQGPDQPAIFTLTSREEVQQLFWTFLIELQEGCDSMPQKSPGCETLVQIKAGP